MFVYLLSYVLVAVVQKLVPVRKLSYGIYNVFNPNFHKTLFPLNLWILQLGKIKVHYIISQYLLKISSFGGTQCPSYFEKTDEFSTYKNHW